MRWCLPALVLLLLAAPATAAANPERALRRCANDLRDDHGLTRLRQDDDLATAARRHARRMARHAFFDHVDDRGNNPWDRIEAVTDRFSAWGENLAAGQDSARGACEGWTESPGHRANLLSPAFTHIGAGTARGGPYGQYYVQEFGG